MNFTDELRSRLSIVDIVGRHVPLVNRGGRMWGCCPFHNEKTPSFTVDESRGRYKCFGCGESGDIISFTMKINNMDFKQAITELASVAGLKMPDYKPKSAEVIASEKSYLEIYENATKVFENALYGVDGESALAYIRGRGFSDSDIKKYRIGYAPRQNTLVNVFRNEKEQNLINTGLIRRGDYGLYDFFRDKLIFPITNANGEIIAFSGRSMDGSEPKYINTGETEMFHKKSTVFGLSFARNFIHKKNRSIVVEGQIDAIKMQLNGFSETVAPLGTALTANHLEILAKHNRNIIFCFDGDTAGQKAAARAAGLVLPLIRPDSDVRFAFMPNKMDPDDVLKSGGVAAMTAILDSAMELVDYLWKLANTNFLVQTPGGRAMAEKFLNSELEKISDVMLKNQYKKDYDARKFKEWNSWKKTNTATTMPVPNMNFRENIYKNNPKLLERDNKISELNAEKMALLREMTPESISRAQEIEAEIGKLKD